MTRAAILADLDRHEGHPARVLLVLASAVAACQPTERDMTPVQNPAGGSGAPLNEEGVGPSESQEPIDDEEP